MRRKRHVPIRTCIACGRKAPQKDLRRIALVEGKPVWDDRRRLPGRGAYVCTEEECLEKARSNIRGCINRAFRRGFGRQELILLQEAEKKSYLPGSNLQR